MARKTAPLNISNASKITQATEPATVQPTGTAPAGRTVAIGIGLKESQVAELDRIAQENDLARNGVLNVAVRRFLDDYRAGRVNLAEYFEVTTTRKLKR